MDSKYYAERLLGIQVLAAGFKDAVVLASGPFIFWYGARFLLFGIRWGVNSTFALVDDILAAIVPLKR